MVEKPSWLRIKYRSDHSIKEIEDLVKEMSLNTVCDEACCPNRLECFDNRTATFMILGKQCTRQCTFCNVTKGIPDIVDLEEPKRLAEAVQILKLRHVVVTSVTRDDLEDGGAGHFVKVIHELKMLTPRPIIEVLIPDFQGKISSLEKIVAAQPDIINHNIETISKLYDEVRPSANYQQSLQLLKNVKEMNPSIYTKSGIMVGLGESEEEVVKVLRDLRLQGCDFLTIGQYLAPSKSHHKVVAYVRPEVFASYEEKAYALGFVFVASGPLVRSSYQAHKVFESPYGNIKQEVLTENQE